MEDILRDIHLTHLRLAAPGNDSLVKSLFGGAYAPLAHFAGLIQVGFGYGLLSQSQFEALEIVRGIRNEAAHCSFEFDLSDPGIKPLIEKLPPKRLGFLPEDERRLRGEVNEDRWEFVWRGLALLSALQTKLVKLSNDLLKKQGETVLRKDWPELFRHYDSTKG
jgi:hypothetical protein